MSREGRRARYATRVEAAALAALEAGRVKAGSVCTIDVYHDDWCALLAGKGPCNCNPSVGAIRSLGEGLLEKLAVLQHAHGRKAT